MTVVLIYLVTMLLLFRLSTDARDLHVMIAQPGEYRWRYVRYGFLFLAVLALLTAGIAPYTIVRQQYSIPISSFLGSGLLFLIMRASKRTILSVGETGRELHELKQSLEHHVVDRTRELQRSQKTLLAILNSMPYGIVVIGKDRRIKMLNEPALTLMNYVSEDEILNHICNQTLCPTECGQCPILDLNQKMDRSERTLVTRDGSRIPILKTVVPVEIEGEEVLLEAFIDITEQKKAEEKIRFLAYYDNLTRLPNRTFYKELLTKAIEHAQRYNRILAVLFIDLDSFKRINDTLGHGIGDQLLMAVAGRLSKTVRKSDYIGRPEEEDVSTTVSRLGGDEFIVLLNEIAHNFNAFLVARRIVNDLAKPFMLSGHEVFITASIGISFFPSGGKDVDSLLKNADIAMYYAKEHGKNNFQFYTDTMNTASFERLTLANDIHRALERNELVIYYQPKIDLETKQIVGMEALLRWNHATRGFISPGEFIPIAEETGIITSIGDWVLHTACKQNKLWQNSGLAKIPVSINISRHQFGQRNFIENIMKGLHESELESRFLELEITESTIMQNPELAVSMLGALKATKMKISIDDFGTGYSSLDHLRWLPLDALKIDRSFIVNIPRKSQDTAIADAIIALAHSLKLKVIAEGVETDEQCAYLRSQGCNEAQGYLFSKPIPAEEFVKLLPAESGK